MSAWFSGCYPTGNRNTTFKQLCNDIFYLVLCYTASSGKPSLWLRGFRELRPWEFMINEPLQDFLFSALLEVQWGQGCSKRSPGRVPKEIQLITRASFSVTRHGSPWCCSTTPTWNFWFPREGLSHHSCQNSLLNTRPCSFSEISKNLKGTEWASGLKLYLQ